MVQTLSAPEPPPAIAQPLVGMEQVCPAAINQVQQLPHRQQHRQQTQLQGRLQRSSLQMGRRPAAQRTRRRRMQGWK